MFSFGNGSIKKALLFDWGDTIMKDFPDKKGSMYTWDKVELMPNAKEMLEKLSQNTRCYLATNAKDSTKSDIIKALNRVGIDHFFTDIFCFKELGYLKPSEEYFNSILSKLLLSKEEIVMIGDNLESDILGVQKLGIDTILYDKDNLHASYDGLKIEKLNRLPDLF